MCHDNEEWCKFEEHLTLPVQNWIEEFVKFWPEHSKIKNLDVNGLLLTKVYNVSAKKSTEELCLMALKIDAKLTCAF